MLALDRGFFGSGTTFAVQTRALIARAKLLSVGTLEVHDTVIYAVCKRGTATSALIFSAVYGYFFKPTLGTDTRRCCQELLREQDLFCPIWLAAAFKGRVLGIRCRAGHDQLELLSSGSAAVQAP